MTMPEATDQRRHALPFVLLALVVAILAGTTLLWAHYGTAVFLEMIRAGIATCFG